MQKGLKVDGNQALKDSLLKGIEYEGIHFNWFLFSSRFYYLFSIEGITLLKQLLLLFQIKKLYFYES